MSPALAAATRRVGAYALRTEEAGGPVVGFVGAAAGGAISADVTVHQSGGDPFSQKQLGDLRYEDLTVEAGVAMPGALFDWVASSWGSQPPARDGALLALGHDFKIQREQPFDDALIAETTLPALDAAAKSPGRIMVRITPRTLGTPTSPGTKLQVNLANSSHKSWLTANFRLTIDGMDTKHVSRIEPLAIRRAIEVADERRRRPDDFARSHRLPRPTGSHFRGQRRELVRVAQGLRHRRPQHECRRAERGNLVPEPGPPDGARAGRPLRHRHRQGRPAPAR